MSNIMSYRSIMCRPIICCGLASAAFFIAAGVVQICAGTILLRSKYVYMLSGPNFWTAAANIVVGCLLGIAITVWNEPLPRLSSRVPRHHLMVALLVSIFLVNVTTTTLLLLGEGNALLSIDVEQSENDLLSGNETLAFAYAASVITPILSASVAVCTILSGCCPRRSNYPAVKVSKARTKRVLSANDSSKYSWVYEDSFAPRRPTVSSRISRSSCLKCYSNQASRSTPEYNCQKISTIGQLGYWMNPSRSSGKHLPAFRCESSPQFGTQHYGYIQNSADKFLPVQYTTSLPRNFKTSIPVRTPVVPTDMIRSTVIRNRDVPVKRYAETSLNGSQRTSRYERDRTLLSSFRGGNPNRRINDECLSVRFARPRFEHKQSIPLRAIEEIPNEDDDSVFTHSGFWLSPTCTSGYGSSASPDTISNKSHRSRIQQEDGPSCLDEATCPKRVWHYSYPSDISVFQQEPRQTIHF